MLECLKLNNGSAISTHISTATQAPFSIAHLTPVAGGFSSHVWHVEGNDGRHYLVKLNSPDRIAMFDAESVALSALAATCTIAVPQIITHGIADGHAFLVQEYLDLHSRGNARLLGTQLAALHRVHSRQFGWEHDNFLGLTPQHNAWRNDWIEFWREQRLGFQLELAARNGYGGALQDLGQRLMAGLPDLLADHNPAPSLLHGDLWGGNHAYLADGTPVIFDPATYYGDREADIAMTELFGGFAPEFYAAYQAAYPLDAGYAKRKTLYNLYHILNHCNMVGSKYARRAEGMLEQLLAEQH